MVSTRKNKSIYIDTEALSSLALVKAGLISPVDGLMDAKTSKEVNKTKYYKSVPFPFSFILAPSGKRNQEVIRSLKSGEVVDLINNKDKVGELTVGEVFEIDPLERVQSIYSTTDMGHPGVKNTIARLGSLAVSGEYHVKYAPIDESISMLREMIKKNDAKKVTGLILTANPLNRSHERVIRDTLSKSDIVVLFLRKPFTGEGLSFDMRYDALKLFVERFLPANKVAIVPFENTYVFAGYNELILDALLVKNYGCNELVVGTNHGGLGLYYDHNEIHTIFNQCKNIGLDITTIDEYVYCEVCKTLVSNSTCPHGRHHHIHYNSDSIMKLIQSGLIPPTILVRKEISASILAALFPNRLKNMQEIYYSLMPSSGLLEDHSVEEFYVKLIELYQTTSLK